ncbi:MAG: sugar transferase [Acidobacteriota bacterium]
MAVRLSTAAVPCPRAPILSLASQRLILQAWLVFTDALVLGLAFRIAYLMRFDLHLTVAPEIVPEPTFYPALALALVPLCLLVFVPFGVYNPHTLMGGVLEYSRTFNACTTAMMAVVLATFVFPTFVVSRGWLIAAWLLSSLLVTSNRFIVRRLAYMLRQRGYLLTPAVVIGTNKEAVALAVDLAEWRTSGLRVMGLVATGMHAQVDPEIPDALPLLGSTKEIRGIIRQYQIEDLVVAITSLNREELLGLCEEVNVLPNVQMKISSGLYELLTTRMSVGTLGSVPLVSLSKVRLKLGEMLFKTLLEYSITIALLLLIWPVLLLIALLIRLDSQGAIIHRRRVLGVGGKEFDAFKFRTMQVNSNDLLQDCPELAQELRSNHKLKTDPRITRLGRWLRRYSLDELPQLFNVLLGQMGLVGPRMISPPEAEKYGRHKLNLLTVKPGITGLWQVSGRSDLSYAERVRLDMYYIRNYSVWLDLQILFVQTLPAVFRGRGAY